jgi:hypothetical protein
MTYGPFQPDIAPGERIARLRALQALALVFARDFPEVGATLAAAEQDRGRDNAASELIERLPTKYRRRILATYSDLIKQRWGAGRGR